MRPCLCMTTRLSLLLEQLMCLSICVDRFQCCLVAILRRFQCWFLFIVRIVEFSGLLWNWPTICLTHPKRLIILKFHIQQINSQEKTFINRIARQKLTFIFPFIFFYDRRTTYFFLKIKINIQDWHNEYILHLIFIWNDFKSYYASNQNYNNSNNDNTRNSNHADKISPFVLFRPIFRPYIFPKRNQSYYHRRHRR